MDKGSLKSWIVKILPSQDSTEAIGTGFWAFKEGYVLTCTHVIQDIEVPWVSYGKEKAPALFIKHEGDIALIQVQGMKGPMARLGLEWQNGDIIDSLGYQYEREHGRIGYFPMTGKILGPSELDDVERITLQETLYVKEGASGAPALNRRTGKVIGIISDKWEKQQITFIIPLATVLEKWEILFPRFQPVDYGQEEIFEYYNTFVGRAKEIEVIRNFLKGKGGEYFLIQGKTGMGKTAFSAELVRMCIRSEFGPQIFCLVVFIRQEGRQNTPEKFLDILNRQLLDLLGIREEIPIHLTEKERQFTNLWRKVEALVSSKNRLLVIIDGLDESELDENHHLVEYLPGQISSYIYWLLTSRPLPDVLDAVPITHKLRRCRSHCLSGLEPQDLRELLRSSGDLIERDEDFIERLIKLTNGEPLFLRFLSQDIAKWGKEAEVHLKKVPEEVTVYFRRQFKLLRIRTKEADDQNLPLEILKILLVAYAGMTVEELAGILGVSILDIREGLTIIERFLLGKECYNLMHLEFRKTASEALLARKEEKLEVLKKLLAYCAKYWKEDRPKERYALQWYLQHLWQLKQYQEMFELCDAGYLEVKLGRLLSPELLESDYYALYEACKESKNLAGLLRWGAHRARIADQVTTIQNLEGIPKVLGKLAQLRCEDWWYRGLGLCALIKGTYSRVNAFLGFCEGLDQCKEKTPREVFQQVGSLLKEINSDSKKDELTAYYVQQLCRWEESNLIQLHDVAIQIGDMGDRSRALSSIAYGYVKLKDDVKAASILAQAFEAATQTESNWWGRSNALSSIAEAYAQLEDTEKATAGLDLILKATAQIEGAQASSAALSAVAKGYGQLKNIEKATAGLDQVLEAATLMEDKSFIASVLSSVAQSFGQFKNVEKAAAILAKAFEATTLNYILNENEMDLSMELSSIAQGYGMLENEEKSAFGLTNVLEVALQIEDDYARSKALTSIAQGYVLLKNVEKATSVLTQAHEAAIQIVDGHDHTYALTSVAQGYRMLKNEKKAAEVLTQAYEVAVQSVQFKEYEGLFPVPLSWVAWSYGYLEDADKVAAGIEKILEGAALIQAELEWCEVLSLVAQSHGQLGDVDKAVKVLAQTYEAALQIKYEMYRSEALCFVVNGYAQLEDAERTLIGLNQVLEAAIQIEKEEFRAVVLSSVAQGYGKIEDIEKVVTSLDRILKAAIDMKSGYYRYDLLSSVAQSYGQLADVDIAAIGLDQVLKIVTKMVDESYLSETSSWDDRFCSVVLSSVAKGYGQLKDAEKATAGLDQVLETATKIAAGAHNWLWALTYRVLCTAARVYSQLKVGGKAANILDLACSKAGHDHDALSSVAEGYVQLEDTEKAVAGLDKVLKASVQGQFEQYRAEALSSVIKCYAQIEDAEKVAACLYQALEAANQMEREYNRAEVFSSIALAAGKLKDVEKAIAVLNKVLEAAAQIKYKMYRSEVLSSVSRGYWRLRNIEKATELLAQSHEAAVQIEDESYRSVALSSVAKGYGELEDGEKAAIGLDQVQKVADQIGDEWNQSIVYSSIAVAYLHVMKLEDTYKFLPIILKDKYFLETCDAIFKTSEKLSEDKVKSFFIDALYRVLPVASLHSMHVYLKVICHALPYLIKIFPPEQVRPILACVEERWLGS